MFDETGDKKMKIGFIGIGLMGSLMAERLLVKGYSLVIWNRTIEKTEKLKNKGANVAENPSAVISHSDLIITMLSDFTAVTSVLFSGKNSFNGKTVLQMSTISPGESIILSERVKLLGGEYVEAPVLGGLAQIPEGKLLPMFGGTKEQFKKWKPFLENFAETITYMGEVGKGSSAKLACNQLIATLIAAFSMSLGYMIKEGIDVESFMQVLRPSSYYVPAFDRKLNNMVTRDFTDTNFPLKHLLKDINIAKREFYDKGINTDVLEQVKDVLADAVRNGLSDSDYSAKHNIINPV